jgi:zinc resistance-associated protein
MNMRLPIALVLTGFISFGAVVAAINAQAQQPPQNDQSSAATQKPDHQHEFSEHEFSAADRAAFFSARIAALHAGLTLTPDQDKLWPAVETALRDAAKTIADRRKLWKDEPRPADPVQMLQRVSEGALARGEALKKLADAAKPLYASLNDEQKHRLPILLAHLRPHRLHFAMGGEHGFQPNGEGHGWSSHDRHDHDGDRDHGDEHEHHPGGPAH